jgi:hypothetical protein
MNTLGNGARCEKHQSGKAKLTKALLGAYAFTATFGALAMGGSEAQSAPHGTTVQKTQHIYTATTGQCFREDAVMRQWNDTIRMEGNTRINRSCTSPLASLLADWQLLVGYTLWKWDDGIASWFTCETSGGWRPAVDGGASIFQDTLGCGDGFYILQIHGAAFLDGAWRVGTAQTDFLELDVNDNPPPI